MPGAVHFSPGRFSLAEVACVAVVQRGEQRKRAPSCHADYGSLGEGQATKGQKVAKMAA